MKDLAMKRHLEERRGTQGLELVMLRRETRYAGLRASDVKKREEVRRVKS